MIDKLKSEDFNGLDSGFRIHSPGGSVDAELIDRRDLGSGEADAGRRRPFSLVFRTAAEAVLEQQTYEIEHEALGRFGIFLVPIGPDEDGLRYEAVFN